MANYLNYMPAFNLAAPMSTLIPYTWNLLEPLAGVFGEQIPNPIYGQLFPSATIKVV